MFSIISKAVEGSLSYIRGDLSLDLSLSGSVAD